MDKNLFNYDLSDIEDEQEKRELSEYCLGREGLAKVKEEDFIDQYEWQLQEYANSEHKLYPCIKTIDFYNLGLHCIRNEISIAKFCRDAILHKLDNEINKEDRVTQCIGN